VNALSHELRTLARWPVGRWVAAAAVAVLVALVTGIPTDLVPTSLFRRMTPIPWWSWPLWVATAILAGLLAGSYVRDHRERLGTASSLGGGVMSFLAVGCPICNKLIVAALGVSGALSYFAPVQPLLGVAGLAVLLSALHRRLAESGACAVPPALANAAP